MFWMGTGPTTRPTVGLKKVPVPFEITVWSTSSGAFSRRGTAYQWMNGARKMRNNPRKITTNPTTRFIPAPCSAGGAYRSVRSSESPGDGIGGGWPGEGACVHNPARWGTRETGGGSGGGRG